MENLPTEIILDIISYLPAEDILKLHLVAKRFLRVGCDNELWRNLCFENSYSNHAISPSIFRSQHQPRRIVSTAPETTVLSSQDEALQAAGAVTEEGPQDQVSLSAESERARSLANWDPTYPGEKVDWYGEYIARHAPLSLSWLQPPTNDGSPFEHPLEARGIAVYRGSRGSKIVAPLEDGSLCLWDVEREDRNQSSAYRRGAICVRSKARTVSATGQSTSADQMFSKARMMGSGVVECVSVDNMRQKAYVAVENGLNEVDLNTLQLSAHEGYPSDISALSECTSPVPLSVGTTLGLHLHDPRQRNNSGSSSTLEHGRIDQVANFPISPRSRNDMFRVVSGDPPAEYGVSILHLGGEGAADSRSGDIYVAGRFPSLLIYDRRTFPKLRSTIHSGARLCSMTSLPYPFRSHEADLMRQNQLSVQAAREVRAGRGETLVACGEYRGKGSLEMYGLGSGAAATYSDARERRSSAGMATPTSTYKNRVSASSSKLLSVATHGTRIVVSDGDGQLRWLERDGHTLVRRWNINKFQSVKVSGIFNSVSMDPGLGDVARKILPLRQPASSATMDSAGRSRDELLLWTGERIGLLAFRSRPEFGLVDWVEREESAEELVRRREQEMYAQTMRRALERQADEVRFVRGLGERIRF